MLDLPGPSTPTPKSGSVGSEFAPSSTVVWTPAINALVVERVPDPENSLMILMKVALP
jgi:hypothetical protein